HEIRVLAGLQRVAARMKHRPRMNVNDRPVLADYKGRAGRVSVTAVLPPGVLRLPAPIQSDRKRHPPALGDRGGLRHIGVDTRRLAMEGPDESNRFTSELFR